MTADKGMAGEASQLASRFRSLLDRMPRTFATSLLIELRRWPSFFEPEKAYLRTLLQSLDILEGKEFRELFEKLNRLEAESGCLRIRADTPEKVRRRTLAHLRRVGQYGRWRKEIAQIFQQVQPRVESRLFPAGSDPRLVILLYGKGIVIKRDELWGRFRSLGIRVPLRLEGAQTPDRFLRALFTGTAGNSKNAGTQTLLDTFRESRNASPLDAWILEAGDALHALFEKPSGTREGRERATGMSYERLGRYREKLADTIYRKVMSGVPGPAELAHYLKRVEVTPQEGITLYSDEVVLRFVRDIFLAGNGTLIINNSFVEWAAVQVLKRAQPHILVARFGVRDKMKPFSSLLLFSKARPTDQIPILEDPLGSFIDAELLSYYVWLNAEKGPPYRGKTMYLLLAEGVDEMLVVPPEPRKLASTTVPPATLPDVAATMARWLGVRLPATSGHPIDSLLS